MSDGGRGGAGAATGTERLLVDEHIRADSAVVRTWLRAEGERVRIEVEIEGGGGGGALSGALSSAAVVHVVRRYARPLEDDVARELTTVPRLALGGGGALAVLHWRAAVDAAGRDWLALLVDGEEPVAALAGGVAAALRYLVARLEGERAGP